jgi:hypothetical protein
MATKKARSARKKQPRAVVPQVIILWRDGWPSPDKLSFVQYLLKEIEVLETAKGGTSSNMWEIPRWPLTPHRFTPTPFTHGHQWTGMSATRALQIGLFPLSGFGDSTTATVSSLLTRRGA